MGAATSRPSARADAFSAARARGGEEAAGTSRRLPKSRCSRVLDVDVPRGRRREPPDDSADAFSAGRARGGGRRRRHRGGPGQFCSQVAFWVFFSWGAVPRVPRRRSYRRNVRVAPAAAPRLVFIQCPPRSPGGAATRGLDSGGPPRPARRDHRDQREHESHAPRRRRDRPSEQPRKRRRPAQAPAGWDSRRVVSRRGFAERPREDEPPASVLNHQPASLLGDGSFARRLITTKFGKKNGKKMRHSSRPIPTWSPTVVLRPLDEA